MIWYLPLEPIESRYSKLMHKWVVEALEDSYAAFGVIKGETQVHDIQQGQWLDFYGTIEYKMTQLAEVSRLYQRGLVQPYDKFLIGDLWFPGLTSIRYMADMSGVGPIELWGWHYAGCADLSDHIQCTCEYSRFNEEGWLRQCDGIFVGSNYFKSVMCQRFKMDFDNVHPLGLAWDASAVMDILKEYRRREEKKAFSPLGQRPKRVIFSHRCAPEKNVELFYETAERFADKEWDFVITSSRPLEPEQIGFRTNGPWRVVTQLSKAEYYDILADSRVLFNANFQETFGYSVHEAIVFGAAPVLPRRVCYEETVQGDSRFLYDTTEEMWDKIEEYVERPITVPFKYTMQYHKAHYKAIDIMLGRT